MDNSRFSDFDERMRRANEQFDAGTTGVNRERATSLSYPAWGPRNDPDTDAAFERVHDLISQYDTGEGSMLAPDSLRIAPETIHHVEQQLRDAERDGRLDQRLISSTLQQVDQISIKPNESGFHGPRRNSDLFFQDPMSAEVETLDRDNKRSLAPISKLVGQLQRKHGDRIQTGIRDREGHPVVRIQAGNERYYDVKFVNGVPMVGEADSLQTNAVTSSVSLVKKPQEGGKRDQQGNPYTDLDIGNYRGVGNNLGAMLNSLLENRSASAAFKYYQAEENAYRERPDGSIPIKEGNQIGYSGGPQSIDLHKANAATISKYQRSVSMPSHHFGGHEGLKVFEYLDSATEYVKGYRSGSPLPGERRGDRRITGHKSDSGNLYPVTSLMSRSVPTTIQHDILSTQFAKNFKDLRAYNGGRGQEGGRVVQDQQYLEQTQHLLGWEGREGLKTGNLMQVAGFYKNYRAEGSGSALHDADIYIENPYISQALS